MEEYYVSQVGNGIYPFEGMRFQRGHGLFSNFIKGKVLPMLKKVLPYLGRTALDTGVSIAKNISEGQSFKSAAKSALKKKAFDIADDALLMAKRKTGSGFKRRRRRKRNSGATILKCVKLRKTIKAKPKKKKKVVKRRKRTKNLF